MKPFADEATAVDHWKSAFQVRKPQQKAAHTLSQPVTIASGRSADIEQAALHERISTEVEQQVDDRLNDWLAKAV